MSAEQDKDANPQMTHPETDYQEKSDAVPVDADVPIDEPDAEKADSDEQLRTASPLIPLSSTPTPHVIYPMPGFYHDLAAQDTDNATGKDDADAIDESNIISERTRGARPAKGSMREPGDDEGIPTDD